VCEFHPICNLSAVGDKDEMSASCGQKVKGQVHGKDMPIDGSLSKTVWFVLKANVTVTVTVTEALVLPPPTLTRRPRAHHRVKSYLGARRQNETKMNKAMHVFYYIYKNNFCFYLILRLQIISLRMHIELTKYT